MKKIICFVTAGLEFNGNSLTEKALGGSESAMIYMAKELAKLDNMVFVYCLCDKPGVYDNVIYLPLDDFYKIKIKLFDVLIVSRFLETLCPSHISGLTIFWMHDLWLDIFEKTAHLCDKVFLMSEYQKQWWVDRNKHYEPMIHVTSNGFDADLASNTPILDFANKKNNYIYASRPERGLKWLLKFMWPQILKINPEAQLRICRYTNLFDQPKEMKKLYKEVEKLIAASKNVSVLGELTKPEYYKVLGESGYMVYPCSFPEISCINAIEAQAMECLVISTDDFALKETVKSPTLAPIGETYYSTLRKLIKEYQNEEKYIGAVKAAKEVMYKEYAWKYVAQAWNEYFDSTFEKRFEEFKPQICKRLGYNSDYVTWSKIDPAFDNGLIEKIKQNNFHYEYHMSLTDQSTDIKTLNELPLNTRQQFMLPIIEDFIVNSNKKLTMLDLGCYDGVLSGTINKKHNNKLEKVIAYDGFQTALDAFKEIWEKNPGCSNIEYVCDDVLNLHSHDIKADIIIVGEILEHIVDYKKTLEDIHRCANKGALIIFSTPIGPWSWIELKENGKTYYEDYHLHHFEMSDIMQMFDGHDVDNNFFFTVSPTMGVDVRNEYVANFIFGYYNNADKEFYEYDAILKAKKTRPYFTISTCMIVKNEENYLYRCLNSIKYISDEIVIVDTGSTDNSLEICKKFTDKIYHLTWEEEDGLGSFERARNYSVEKATGDWIFWIDADEELAGSSQLADYTRSIYVPAFGLLQKQLMIEGETGNDQFPDRLFKRGSMKFYGVVHEQPKQHPIKENDIIEILIPASCRLHHLGYIDNSLRYNKVKRNHVLLLKNIKRYPELLDNHGYLIRDMLSFYHYSNGDIQYLKKAVDLWKKYPRQFHTVKERTFWFGTFSLMQQIYSELRDKKEARFIKKEQQGKALFFQNKAEFKLFLEVMKAKDGVLLSGNKAINTRNE